MADFKTIKGKFRRYEATVPVCLDGEALGALDAARARMVELSQSADDDSLAGAPGFAEARAEVERLEQDVADATLPFRLRALPRSVYRMLEAEHPDPDGKGGWNVETFPKALIRACLIDPKVDPDEATELIDDMLTSGGVEALFDACWSICNSQQRAPFPRAASVTT